MALGILLVSHVPAIANGVETLIKQVAKDVPITTAGGTSDGKIGTDLDHIQKAIGDNPASELLVFYDRSIARSQRHHRQNRSAIETTKGKVSHRRLSA